MKVSYSELWTRGARAARRVAVPTVFAALVVVGASGRAHAAAAPEAAKGAEVESYHVLQLNNATSQSDAIDIVTDLRNMLPRARVFYVNSRDAITMMGTEQDYEVAQRIVGDLSRGPRVFRLTYAFTDLRVGQAPEHHSAAVIVNCGSRAMLKQGERVPVVTGGNVTSGHDAAQQVQYLDVGLNINADLSGTADNLRLQTRITHSAIVQGKSDAGAMDPVLRQTVLDDVATVPVGKAVKLGSFAIPGTSEQEQVEVTAEPVQ